MVPPVSSDLTSIDLESITLPLCYGDKLLSFFFTRVTLSYLFIFVYSIYFIINYLELAHGIEPRVIVLARINRV